MFDIKQHPFPTTIESLDGNPIWDSLVEPVTSPHSQADLTKILWKLGGGGATIFVRERQYGVGYGSTVADEEDRTMLLVL